MLHLVIPAMKKIKEKQRNKEEKQHSVDKTT